MEDVFFFFGDGKVVVHSWNFNDGNLENEAIKEEFVACVEEDFWVILL